MIAFFEQCQVTDKAAGVLEKIAKDKKQSKERKQLIFLLHVAVNQATTSIAVTNTAITIKATDAIVMIANQTIVIKMINTMMMVNVTTRT
jgi:hypothetical protein